MVRVKNKPALWGICKISTNSTYLNPKCIRKNSIWTICTHTHINSMLLPSIAGMFNYTKNVSRKILCNFDVPNMWRMCRHTPIHTKQITHCLVKEKKSNFFTQTHFYFSGIKSQSHFLFSDKNISCSPKG